MSGFITGLLFLLIGYLIKYRKWSWLISGYNTASREKKARYDQEALCQGTGNFAFFLAAVSFVVAVAEVFQIRWLNFGAWGVFVGAVFWFLIYANTGNRFRR